MIRTGEVFPPRNLPDPAVPWGRDVETRIQDMESLVNGTETGLQSENRTTAATAASLARQADQLELFFEELDGLLDDLEELYRAIPKTTTQVATGSSFSTGTAWTTVASATVTPPAEGATSVSVTALGNILAWGDGDVQDVVYYRGRIVIAGNASGNFEASVTPFGDWQAIANPLHGRTFSTSSPFTVLLQAQANVAAMYPADSRNRATLTVLSSWTG